MNHRLKFVLAAVGALFLVIAAVSAAGRQAPAPIHVARAGASLASDIGVSSPRPPVVGRKVIAGYAPGLGARAPRPAAVGPKVFGGYAPDLGVRAPQRATAGPSGSTNVLYYNWSGYAATGSAGTFTQVSGSWTVPTESPCTYEHQTDSQWVGIDGFNNSTVEQAGTIMTCYYDVAYYEDWYEMYPTQPNTVVEHSVSPGDKVSAKVTRSGSSYTLTVTDSTHSADSFTVTTTCSTCQNDSAEWINERDNFACCGYSPLSDYGTWTLTSGAATASGKSASIGSQANLYNVGMEDATGYYYLSYASPLSGGNSFTTTWYDTW